MKYYKLKNLLSVFRNGATIKQIKNSSGVPISRIETISNGTIDFNKVGYADIYNDNYKEYYLQDGDILFSHINSIPHLGKCAIFQNTDKTLIHGMNLLLLRANKNILSKYLFYLLKSKPFRAKLPTITKKSVNQASLSITNLGALDVCICSLDEQQRIVNILDKAEEIRTKKKLANEKLDEFLKSTFIDMFGDPVTNPNNYQFVCLGDLTTEICDIGSNGSNAVVAKNLKMSDTEDYAYMIRAVNFSDNNIFENMKYVSKEVYDFFRKSQIFGNEIIMCKIGSAGKFWLMPKLNKPTSLGLNSFLMRFNDNTNRIFIYHYLNTSYGQIEINTRVSGAVTKSITKGAIRTIPVYLPDIEQQNQFAKIVQKVDTQKEKNQKVIEQMDNLFNSLMQQAFNSSL